MDIARGEAGKFMGREDELFRVKEYLLSSRTGPFVVYGPTGSGKTCFISKIATMTGSKIFAIFIQGSFSFQLAFPETWFSRDDLTLMTVVRFLCRTPSVKTVGSALHSVCQQG